MAADQTVDHLRNFYHLVIAPRLQVLPFQNFRQVIRKHSFHIDLRILIKFRKLKSCVVYVWKRTWNDTQFSRTEPRPTHNLNWWIVKFRIIIILNCMYTWGEICFVWQKLIFIYRRWNMKKKYKQQIVYGEYICEWYSKFLVLFHFHIFCLSRHITQVSALHLHNQPQLLGIKSHLLRIGMVNRWDRISLKSIINRHKCPHRHTFRLPNIRKWVAICLNIGINLKQIHRY